MPTIERLYDIEVKKKAIEVFYTEGNAIKVIISSGDSQKPGSRHCFESMLIA